MSILVIDVGTTTQRAALVHADSSVSDVFASSSPPDSPFPGLVEFDAMQMGASITDAANAAIHAANGAVDAVGITAQRASTIVWDRVTGEPIGPGIGWQDLRTVFDCITIKAEHGLALAPNQSATKIAWLLNTFDPERSRDLLFGTVDTWLTWVLSGGQAHLTDHTNAAVTGLYDIASRSWSATACQVLNIPMRMLPTIVDSSGELAVAAALDGQPLIAGLVGDQQASLVGQGCVQPGAAKITFGSGGMLDICTGAAAPVSERRNEHGTFPVVAWSITGEQTWGAEAIMLSAGTNVEWLVEDMQILDSPAHSHEVAAQCATTDGVVFVPAPMGLGTPQWDFGARSGLFGLTRGSGRPQIVRAVLEGVAQRGADLVDAAEADTGLEIPSLRLDGGMSVNPTFVQAVADATGKRVEVAPVTEATMLGAGYLAGLACGVWPDLAAVGSAWSPASVVEPQAAMDRDRWRDAVERSRRWIPDLSALDF